MNRAIPRLSLWDNLILNLGYLMPTGLQGTFTRNRTWVSVLARVHPDPAGVGFLRRLRARYRGD